jgi:protoporphyrin/coproporphyrin ferrochelatase
MAAPIGVVMLNLGGPDSPEAVEPFLRNLFADPDVIQLGWLRFLQPMLAKMIARRRAPLSREAYGQIGGRSPIREESVAQATAVADALTRAGLPAKPYVAMGCWHPFSDEAVAAMRADGVTRAVAVPLYPHYSRTTTGSSFTALERALAGSGIELAKVERYPDAPGYIEALADRVRDAIAALPSEAQPEAPVLFSAHGLPESYIRRGDPYLDDVRITVAAVTRTLRLGARAQLCFQSRVGPQKWLGPYTEEAIDRLAEAGHKSVAICPVAFTGEHIETLQEIDILYRERATARGIVSFSRARTVGVHPAFIGTLAELARRAAAKQGWVSA